MKAIWTILLLLLSNVFMTLAWYGQLRFKDFSWGKGLGVDRSASLRRHHRFPLTLWAQGSRSPIRPPLPGCNSCSLVGYFVQVSSLRRALSGRTIAMRAIRSRYFGPPLGLFAVILISWGLAFFEYVLNEPAERLGHLSHGGPFSLVKLKVIQEVTTLVVFTALSLIAFKNEALRWNHALAVLLPIVAVLLVFKK